MFHVWWFRVIYRATRRVVGGKNQRVGEGRFNGEEMNLNVDRCQMKKFEQPSKNT